MKPIQRKRTAAPSPPRARDLVFTVTLTGDTLAIAEAMLLDPSGRLKPADTLKFNTAFKAILQSVISGRVLDAVEEQDSISCSTKLI